METVSLEKLLQIAVRIATETLPRAMEYVVLRPERPAAIVTIAVLALLFVVKMAVRQEKLAVTAPAIAEPVLLFAASLVVRREKLAVIVPVTADRVRPKGYCQ